MQITYKVNGVPTTKSLAEWYFGVKFVAAHTKHAVSASEAGKKNSIKVWQNGTGYLAIEIH